MFLQLLLLGIFLFVRPLQGQELKVMLGNEEYSNNSVVMLESIGEDVNPLVCITNFRPCCKGSSANPTHGNWRYPNNTAIKSKNAGYGFHRNRGTAGEVNLRRRQRALSPMGSYCCDVPTTNSNPNNERICIILLRCQPLGAPANAMITYTSQMEDEVTVTYTCEPGFGLVGNPVRTCLPTWTGDEPHCQPLCPDPTAPANGKANVTGHSIGNFTVYTCNDGFELIGSNIATCTPAQDGNNATFLPSPPECHPLCLYPTAPTNGDVNVTGNSTGDNATYTCNDGFELIGNDTATCTRTSDLNNASFIPEEPICYPLCASPPAPANGQVTLTGNSVGDTATYTCNIGYELSGQNASTCMLAPDNNNTASFEPPAPTCDRFVVDLQVEQNGTVYVTNNTVLLLDSIGEEDEKALICRTDKEGCCDSGVGDWFFPDLSMVLRNLENGSFYCNRSLKGQVFLRRRYNASSPLGTYCCKAPTKSSGSSDDVFCVFLNAIVFTVPVTGAVEGVRFELNCSLGIYSEATINSITWTSSDNEITDTRDEDSLMLTFDPLTSDDAGIYACSIIFDTTTITKSYELAPRIVHCPNLTEKNNGNIIFTGLTAGNNATYSCDHGFELLDIATDVRTCQPDGSWSLPEPQCVAPVEVTIANNNNTQHAGENYTLTCTVSGGGTDVPSYQWLKNGSYLTNETAKTLSLTPLTQGNSSEYACKATKSRRVVESDSIDVDVMVPPLTLEITPSGSPDEGQNYSLTCDLMGDESLNVTERIFQWDTSELTNISQEVNLTFYSLSRHNESNYTCTTTITSPYLTSVVVLNSTEILTVNLICPILNAPDSGNVNVTGQYNEDNATYTCDSEFTLLDPGSGIRTCQPDGNWTGSEPQCVAQCPELQDPANGTVNISGRRLSGDNATYTCDVPFELLHNTSGSNVSICLGNGTWSGFNQQCITPVTVNVTGGNATHAGENYTLTCTVSGGGADVPTYQWLQDGSYLTNETSDTLSFTPLTQNSSGKYVCVATKSGRVVESEKFAINVTVPPLTLAITANGSPIEGQTYSLTCDLMGDESLDVDVMFIWERPSSEMNVSQNAVFEPLNCTDDGDYICTAMISSPYLGDMIVLDKTETVTVNCMCPVLSHPDNGMVMVSGQFGEDNVTYTCNSGFELLDLTPGNDVRTCQPGGTWSESEAQCIAPVTVNVTGSGATQHAGEDYTLTCTVSGGENNATTTYQWFNGSLLLSGETSATLSFTPLRQTTPSSNGQYVCEAMRSGRNVSSNSSTVEVQTPPLTISVTFNGLPVEGQTYSATCDLTGDELLDVTNKTTTWEWLTPENQPNVHTGPTLSFAPLSRDDAGVYNCKVTITSPYFLNAGTRTRNKTINVTIAQKPEPITNLQAHSPTATTISLTWDMTGDISIERFEVSYSYTVNTCTAPAGSGMVTISDGTRRSHTLSGVNEDSQYTITVTAINSAGNTSNTTTASTLTSSPAGFPENINSTMSTATTIILTWDELNCVDRNGVITGYVIQYGITTFNTSVNVTGTSASDRTFTASGLVPLTTYMFRITAVNSDGVGPYSNEVNLSASFPTELTLKHNNQLLDNQSIVDLRDIMLDDSRLFCLTNSAFCCRNRDANRTGAIGLWYFPNDTVVPGKSSGINRDRGASFVALNSSNTDDPTGLYRCEIPDTSGVNRTLFAGIYRAGEGMPRTDSPIEYSFSSRTLTCISTGGPATTVTWRRDSVFISESQSTRHQQLTEISTATYHNLLTLNTSDISDYSGSFSCTVSNRRGSDTQNVTLHPIQVTGNGLFQLSDTTRISCSTPVPVESLQWVNSFNNSIVREGRDVQELVLDIDIRVDSNGTQYFCRVVEGNFTAESDHITIVVGGDNFPRLPDEVDSSSTERTVTITWSFTSVLETRNETFTVLYGTSSGQLALTSPPVSSVPNVNQYSIQLTSLQPGTTYYYQIQSENIFTTLTDPMDREIRTMDIITSVTGNGLFQLDDTTRILCSTPISVDILQWVNSYNDSIVRKNTTVHELILDIDIRVDSNGTQYFCRVMEGNFTAESENITIYVGGDNFPRLPDLINASSTESTVTITWSFTSVLETRNETFTVLYGTSSGQLALTSPPVSSVPNVNQYSIQLTSLQPGTTYYYQIQSENIFTTLTDPMDREIRTMDIIISVTGNGLFQLGDTTRILCSTPISVDILQWVNSYNDLIVRKNTTVHELILDIDIRVDSNGTQYFCRVMEGNFTAESENITIYVGGDNFPRLPDLINASSTESTVTITWSFTSVLETRNETFTVLYGTSSGQLALTSPPVSSVPNVNQYSIQLMSLQPATIYYYQIRSANIFTSLTDSPERDFRTMDNTSSPVTNIMVTSLPLDDSTLLLDWQPPESPNGITLHYVVVISSEDGYFYEDNITGTSYNMTNLTPGVPYDVSIIPVNLAGDGEFETQPYFTKELTPSMSPNNIMVERSTPTTMLVSWTPLTLSEARGFVTFYTVAYTPVLNSRRRQVSQDTMYMNVSADSSSVTIVGLDGSLAYSVQVSAGTKVGQGELSEAYEAESIVTTAITAAEPGGGSSNTAVTGAIVGITLAIVVAVAVVLVIIIIKYRQRRGAKYSLKTKDEGHNSNIGSVDKTPIMATQASSPGSGTAGNPVSIELEEKVDITGEEEQDYVNTSFLARDRSKVVSVEDFREHVQNMHEDRDRWFELEYNAIEKSPQADHDFALIYRNRERNRFANIFPYNFNRVELKMIPEKEPYSDYINASYIDGYKRRQVYIASQGPTDNSVEDFWRMIWELRIPTVVMLTRIFEGRKKCEHYWPETDELVPTPGSPLTITSKSTLPFAEFVIRKMVVTHSGEESSPPLEVTQYHYRVWPDHGVPSNTLSMINFIKRVRKTHPYSRQDLLLVHCSAGVGRTGTFITLDYMLERIDAEKTINVCEYVNDLRKQRVLMVQTVSQYIFIHDALAELLTSGETEIAAANMRIVISRLGRNLANRDITGFHEQFEILRQVTQNIKNVDTSIATSEANTHKNRYKDKIPYNHNRVCLRSAVQGSDYINASFVDGYRRGGVYIATQGPLPHTVNDFWRMVWENEVKCIVMLCKTQEKQMNVCHRYWPSDSGSSESYGKYQVLLTSEETKDEYFVRKMDISDSQATMSPGDNGFTVTQFQYVRWPEDGVPQSTTGVLEMANLVQKVQMGSGNKAIVVMCNDGVGRTGTFICTHAEMERMKAEIVVDLFQFIKAARLQRAGMVANKDQYEFGHQVLADFLDGFDTYANFKEIV